MSYNSFMNSRKLIQQMKLEGRGERQIVSFRFPSLLYKEFDDICEKEGLSKSEMLIRLMKEFIDDYKGRARKKK